MFKFNKRNNEINTKIISHIDGYELITKLKEKIGYKAYIFVILFLVGKNWRILDEYLDIVAHNYGKKNSLEIEQRYLEEKIGSNVLNLEDFNLKFYNNKLKYITEKELKRLNENFEQYGNNNKMPYVNRKLHTMPYVINRKLNRSEFSCVINLDKLYESVECLLNKNKENNMSNVFNQLPGLLEFYNLKQKEILNLLKQEEIINLLKQEEIID
jgi:hypothetical protein